MYPTYEQYLNSIPTMCIDCKYCEENEEQGYDHYEHFCVLKGEEINSRDSACSNYEE